MAFLRSRRECGKLASVRESKKKISGAAGDMGKAREERNLLAEFT